MMSKKMTVNSRKKQHDMDLVDVLYSSPSKISAWFKEKCVNISAEDCEKLMIHIDM